MSVIRFRTTAKGKLPHLSYILRKPEPLGTELNTSVCSVTGYLIFIEVHRGKEGRKSRKYHLRLGDTESCTKRMTEATKGIGQRDIEGATKDCFIFGSWFFSKKLAEAVIDFGADMIGMVKNNTKGFCKETI